MHDTNKSRDRSEDDDPRYQAVEFTDGVIIYDRTIGTRWMYADKTVPLDQVR